MRASSAGRAWSRSSNRASVVRLVGTILAEQDGRLYFRPETMAAIDAVTQLEEMGQPLLLTS